MIHFLQQKKNKNKKHNITVLKALIAMKHVVATHPAKTLKKKKKKEKKKRKKKHCFSSLIKWCETHRQCLIKTLVSHPELLGFQPQETGSGLLNNSM